ncbi:hypothetical protein ACFZDI_30340 [Streptomyces sp. NPDC007907]|uniref:hypothetical protein n=1 Tax=Streptomyces sp. NPDC007907 TaxID=3364789 RepID=UPI0036E098E8
MSPSRSAGVAKHAVSDITFGAVVDESLDDGLKPPQPLRCLTASETGRAVAGGLT